MKQDEAAAWIGAWFSAGSGFGFYYPHEAQLHPALKERGLEIGPLPFIELFRFHFKLSERFTLSIAQQFSSALYTGARTKDDDRDDTAFYKLSFRRTVLAPEYFFAATVGDSNYRIDYYLSAELAVAGADFEQVDTAQQLDSYRRHTDFSWGAAVGTEATFQLEQNSGSRLGFGIRTGYMFLNVSGNVGGPFALAYITLFGSSGFYLCGSYSLVGLLLLGMAEMAARN